MERVIKFRALVKGISYWHYGSIISYRDGTKYIASEDDEDLNCLLNRKAINETIGQFTGLTDKNGKEIYEGDVVKWGMHKGSEENFHRYARVVINPDIQFNIIHYVNSKTGGYVKGDDDIFHFGRFAYKDTNRHLEVIGNIYEDPELLSTDKTKTV